MLQIRLSKGTYSEAGGGAKPLPVETVMVACPDHLVLADLPVAKSLATAPAASVIKNVGRRSRRPLGERVHFCVRCDFPIAIYGRLSPCDHAFCLDCARSDSICYLCDERIQKIQTIKMMEGIFICAAPHCLKSFLRKSEFESHIHETHADLLQPNADKEDGIESEAVSGKQSTASDSTARAPPKTAFSPSLGSQVHDREDKARLSLPRDQPSTMPVTQPRPPVSFFGQTQTHQLDPQANNYPQSFDRSAPQNRFPQQGFDAQGMMPHESNQSDKQQGILAETPFSEYPLMHGHQAPNFAMTGNLAPVLAAPPFSYPPFTPEGVQTFYSAPFDMARSGLGLQGGPEQGSLLGFPPGSTGAVNFPENYPRPWNVGPVGTPFDPSSAGQGIVEGFANMADPQGATFFQGDYTRNMGGLTPSMPGGSTIDPRDRKGVLASQPLPTLQPPHLSQQAQDKSYPGDMGHEGQGFGWQYEKHDSFGNSQD